MAGIVMIKDMDLCVKLLLNSLMVLFVGATFFIPDIVVDRFHTAPYLFVGGCLGVMGVVLSVLLRKKTIVLPPLSFLLIAFCWLAYRVCRIGMDLALLNQLLLDCIAFVVAYCVLLLPISRKHFYTFFALLGVSVALMGLFQYIGVIRSFHSAFPVTGAFDNPAGISALLVALLPFCLFFSKGLSQKRAWMGIGSCILMLLVIVFSGARAAILACGVLLFCYLTDRGTTRHCRWKLLWLGILGSISLLVLLYFVNINSANGRLLIWRCCMDLIDKSPFWGVGEGSFQAFYMLVQADYFLNNGSGMWVMVSDNIHHPLNEYLKVIVEQGIVGFVLLVALLGCVIRCYKHSETDDKRVAFLSLIAIAVCSFFSYPFDYPVMRLLFIFLIAILLLPMPDSESQKTVKWNRTWMVSFLFLSLISIVSVARQGYCEVKWKKMMDADLAIHNSEYKRLSVNGFFHHRASFLYTYGVMLNEAGLAKESIDILQQCSKLANDYDIQLLQGYNYVSIGQLPMAEKYFRMAANMIPGRFLPRYELFKIYERQAEYELAKQTALQIAAMPVKAPSSKVSFMKAEIDYYLLNH